MNPKPTRPGHPPTWQSLPEPLRQQVIAQIVKLLLKQIEPAKREGRDEPSQDQ